MKNTLLLIAASFVVVQAASRAQTAEEIIRKAEGLMKGKTSRGTFVMTVVTPDYTRKMEMDSWWVGSEKALIVIKSPAREAGNKTLKVGNELWMYLRNTETTIKVPPSMMLQSWNGSDFTNDDLVRESDPAKDYLQAILAEEAIQGAKCWKIKLTPKPNAPVVWGSILYWVRKEDFLPARMEYFDERGTLMRVMNYADYQKFGGRKLPGKWIMESATKKNHRTEFDIKDMEFDVKISDRIFSFRELERGR
jgi:outer membrane lipoprotein-sorting protein